MSEICTRGPHAQAPVSQRVHFNDFIISERTKNGLSLFPLSMWLCEDGIAYQSNPRPLGHLPYSGLGSRDFIDITNLPMGFPGNSFYFITTWSFSIVDRGQVGTDPPIEMDM